MNESGANGEALRGAKLLHVTTVPVTFGFLSGHVGYATARGVEVHALSSPGAKLDRFRQKTNVPVHTVPMSRRITPVRDLRALWRIRRLVGQLRPDIVHGHTPKGGLLAMLAAWLGGVPVRVYHMYGLPLLTARGLKRHLLRWAERLACRLANQVLCLSRSLRDRAIAEGLCPPDKIKVLLEGNIDGVDAEHKFNPERFPPPSRQEVREPYGIPPDAPVIGFVGRIVRDKGLVELEGAWQLLREEFPELRLLIAGEPEPQDPIPADVDARLRADPRVCFAGQLSDMPRFYTGIDLLVLPTYREGFGTVLLEAAAMGLPVVSTRIPGCVDAVRDGETATLVPSHDAAALAGAVRDYLRDPALRRQHGEAGRQRVLRDFQPEAMREALYQEYVRLLGDSRLRQTATRREEPSHA